MLDDCTAYEEGCRVQAVPLDGVGEWVRCGSGFIWIGLFEPTEEGLRTVQAQLGLHELAIEDGQLAHQRPKLEEYGDAFFVVLHAARWNPEKRTVQRGETHVFVGAHYVVSVRHGDTGSYTPVRGRCEATPVHLKFGPGFVLYAIMDFVVDNYFAVIEHFEDRLGKLEERIFGGSRPQRDVAQRIYDLKRRLIHLKRAVSPLIDVCNRLNRYDTPGLIPDEVR